MTHLTHRLAICLVIASSLLVMPRPAAAATHTHVFDTVEAVEFSAFSTITVTGILAGQTTPTTVSFEFFYVEVAQRCERMALLVLSKPGKYQLHIGGLEPSYDPGCKLIRLAP